MVIVHSYEIFQTVKIAIKIPQRPLSHLTWKDGNLGPDSI